MAEQVGEIYYDVDFRLDGMTSKVKTAEGNLDKLDDSFKKTDRSANQLNTGLSGLAKAISAVIAASALRDMARLVQSYQEMAERVQMATSSQAEYEMVQKRLLTTANGTYRTLAEAQELFIRTNASLRSMGYNTSQAVDVMDSLSYSFVTNATSADRANAAISAVSKSFNTGKVAADQWETVSSAIPTVIEQIAAASGKGAAEIRALGAAGKLTAQDLSEGLRKSLDQNSAAAADMANNLTDAGVRMRTALQITLVALEDQTGALDTFTNGIIAAADMMIDFAGDADKMATGLATLEIAATSLAAIMAGRMVMAMAAGAQGFYAATVAATAKARADVAAAQSAAALAAQELIAARAAEQAAIGLSTHAAAAARLTAAQAAATAATTTLSNAQRVMAGTATLATRALGLLRGAYALIGGPAGVAILAATAIYTFFTRSREAKAPVDDLTKSVKELSSAQRELAALETSRKLEELSEKAFQLGENLKYAQEQTGGAGKRSQRYAEDALRMRVEQEKLNEEISTYRKRLDELNNYKAPVVDGNGGDKPNLTPPTDPAEEKAAQRAIDAIKERVEALQLEADTLGMTETELELYKLQLAGATDEQIRAAATSRGLIDAYEMQTEAAEKAAEAEARRKEELQSKLMQADPQAAAAADYEKQLTDLRTLNEAKLIEDERYMQLKADLEAQYAEQRRVAEEEAFMRQSTANQLLIESINAMGEASTQALSGLLSGASNGQEAMRQLANTILNTVIGTFIKMGTEWVKQQIVQRAATQATIATQQAGIGAVAATQQAATASMAATTTATAATTGAAVTASMAPAAGVASVASFGGAAVAGIAALLASMAIARGISGRLHGGPVDPGNMYRINENGAPEVFQSANGRQYMLPNTRGDVISNKDATSGVGVGGTAVTVVVHNNASGATASASSRETDEGTIIDIVVSNLMQDGPIGQAVNQITGTQRAGQ